MPILATAMASSPPPDEKICSCCNQWKKLNDFYFQENRQQYTAACKICKRKLNNAARNKERNNKIGTLRTMLHQAKRRAKNQNIPFSLSIEDLDSLYVTHCPITLQPLDWTREFVTNALPHDNTPSLDKNIPQNGYIRNNCAIISYKANRLKNNGTLDEHRRIVQYMAKQQLRDLQF